MIADDSAASAAASAAAPALAPLHWHTLAGDPWERGLQLGRQQAGAIHAFLEDRFTRVNPMLAQPLDWDSVRPALRAYDEVIGAALPQYRRELEGLAAGAQIDYQQALWLQLRRELVGYRKMRPGGDCTSFARRDAQGVILGQTIDLNGAMHSELCGLKLHDSVSGRRSMMLSFTGLLGYLGMNDSGLAVCLNLVLAGDWGPGIPGYLAIRYLLDQADTVEQALALLERLPLASSRALTLADSRRMVTVEYVRNSARLIEQAPLVHANHFLHPDWVPQDQLNPFARTGSLRRQQACADALAALPRHSASADYMALLDRAPVHVADNGQLQRECTVGAVLMRPAEGEMLVRRADPAAAVTRHLFD
ncbi:peptidase C45 [Oxalobacteraceae bacterium]|nr:peptidase C45 [Oxalobacteraceae bacterium]